MAPLALDYELVVIWLLPQPKVDFLLWLTLPLSRRRCGRTGGVPLRLCQQDGLPLRRGTQQRIREDAQRKFKNHILRKLTKYLFIYLYQDRDKKEGGITLERYKELYAQFLGNPDEQCSACLLYTSDAADE